MNSTVSHHGERSCAHRAGLHEPAQLPGRDSSTLIPAVDLARYRSQLHAVRAGNPTAFENRLQRADGTLIHVHWSASWSKSSGQMYCVVRDVSALMISEQRMVEAQHIAHVGSWNLPAGGGSI